MSNIEQKTKEASKMLDLLTETAINIVIGKLIDNRRIIFKHYGLDFDKYLEKFIMQKEQIFSSEKYRKLYRIPYQKLIILFIHVLIQEDDTNFKKLYEDVIILPKNFIWFGTYKNYDIFEYFIKAFGDIDMKTIQIIEPESFIPIHDFITSREGKFPSIISHDLKFIHKGKEYTLESLSKELKTTNEIFDANSDRTEYPYLQIDCLISTMDYYFQMNLTYLYFYNNYSRKIIYLDSEKKRCELVLPNFEPSEFTLLVDRIRNSCYVLKELYFIRKSFKMHVEDYVVENIIKQKHIIRLIYQNYHG